MRFFSFNAKDNDNKGENDNNSDNIFYGTTSEAFDIRYQDDGHMTYGKSYNNDNEDNK